MGRVGDELTQALKEALALARGEFVRGIRVTIVRKRLRRPFVKEIAWCRRYGVERTILGRFSSERHGTGCE